MSEVSNIWDDVLNDMQPVIIDERAIVIRQMRVVDGYTWRKVAEECHRLFSGHWSPPSNQINGMALCYWAAKQFGEDYLDDKWN